MNRMLKWVISGAACFLAFGVPGVTTAPVAGHFVKTSEVCVKTMPSCAPRPTWDCVHIFGEYIVIIQDKCDPVDEGCELE
jgi:hypothetical protein